LSSLAAWAVRHARAVLALALLLALAAAVAATQLPTDAATDTLVDSDTPGYRATEPSRANAALAHPALERLVRERASVVVDAAYWACGLPQSLDSVTILRAAGP